MRYTTSARPMPSHVRTRSVPTPWKHLNLLLTRSLEDPPTHLSASPSYMSDSRNLGQGGYRIPDNGTMFRTDCKLISRSILARRALHWYEVTDASCYLISTAARLVMLKYRVLEYCTSSSSLPFIPSIFPSSNRVFVAI